MAYELLNGYAEAEQSVIGSILIDERCVPVVLNGLREDDFIDSTCRAAFRAVKSLVNQGKATDLISIVDAMGGVREHARWAKELMSLTPTAANVQLYMEIVQKNTSLYRLRELAGKLEACFDLDEGKHIVQKMASLISATSRMPRMTAADLAKDFLQRMQSKEKPEYLPWGFPTADKYAYAELGDFILLGGYSSAGKTLISIIMALAQAKRYKVGYYSLETRPEKMADRIFAHLAGIPLDRIKTRSFQAQDWTKMAESTSNFVSACPFDIIHATGSTVEDIFTDAVANGYQSIFIDYLQLIKVPEIRAGDRYATVTEISQRIKTAGQRFGIAVTGLCQLSRPETVKKKGGEELLVPPNMHSFRESGQLEQDADLAFLLWAVDANDNQSRRRFKLAKNKEGRKFSVELEFMGGTQTMVEVAPPSVSAQYVAEGRAIKQRNRNEAQRRQKMEETKEVDSQMQIFPEDDNPFEPKE